MLSKILAVLCLVGVPLSLGQETTRTQAGVDAQTNPQKIIDGQKIESKPQVARVRLVSEILGVAISSGDQALGRIQDVAFDLETGHMALIVASRQIKGKQFLYTLLPVIDFANPTKFAWKNNRAVEKLPDTFTRSLVCDIYETYERDIYWIDFLRGLEESLRDEFDPREYKLTTFSYIKGRPVIDKDGQSVGKIVDFCIRPSNGEILYCVMASENNELRAIPLGAFVMQKPNFRWTIELTKDLILKFETFQRNSPPTRVDRGWSEYIAVRYGRGGLQSQKKSEK